MQDVSKIDKQAVRKIYAIPSMVKTKMINLFIKGELNINWLVRTVSNMKAKLGLNPSLTAEVTNWAEIDPHEIKFTG